MPSRWHAEGHQAAGSLIPHSSASFAAWPSGNGTLANVALDRALADDPSYSTAVVLRQVIDSGAPPSLARLPMTHDDMATSYDALEASGEADEDDEDDSGGLQDG